MPTPTPLPSPTRPAHPLTTDAPRRSPDVLVATAIEHLDEEDELWQLIEERITSLRENADGTPAREPVDRDPLDREPRRRR